jgi:hypothetical protein
MKLSVSKKVLIENMGVPKHYLLPLENRKTIDRIYRAFKKKKDDEQRKKYLYYSYTNSHLTERNKDYIWQKYQAVRQEETLYSLGELHIENIRMLHSHVQTNAHGV